MYKSEETELSLDEGQGEGQSERFKQWNRKCAKTMVGT
jgi:hypothetical protein